MTAAQRAELFTGPLDSSAYFLERFLIENKFMGLFSFLFGISFWLFICRTQTRLGIGLFYRRIAWLFAIGLIHGALLWWGDILRFYALWALVLPFFARIAVRRLLAVAVAVGVLVPALIVGAHAWFLGSARPTTDYDALALAAFSSGTYYDVVVANLQYDAYLTFSVAQVVYQAGVFGRLLFGLYVARTLELGNLGVHRALLWRVAIVGGLVGAIGSTVFSLGLLATPIPDPSLRFLRRWLVEGGQMGLTAAYAAGLALLFLSPYWQRGVRLLAPVGRMALTWYLLQTLFAVWLFYRFTGGPALIGKVPAAAVLGLALAGFGIQIVLAHAWLRRFRFGPAEWLWRTLTYWKVQPLRITTPGPTNVAQA
jgi:uncharacterized protein